MSAAGKPPALKRSARYLATRGTFPLPIELSMPTMLAKISRAWARTGSAAAAPEAVEALVPAAASATLALSAPAPKQRREQLNPIIFILSPWRICTNTARITEPYATRHSNSDLDDRAPCVRSSRTARGRLGIRRNNRSFHRCRRRRERARRRTSRRGGCRPGGRTLRHLGSGAGRHPDRGLTHRVLDGCGRRGGLGPGARYGVCG